jgi:group I intron endonuclease
MGSSMPIVYITTNLINGKKYLGKRVKNYPWYFGSGWYIVAAIKKYGRENFVKEIVFEHESMDIVCEKEKELSIKWNVVEDPKWYNIKYGGKGGSPKGRKLSAQTCMRISESKKGHPSWNAGLFGDERCKHKEETKKKISDANKGQKNPSGKNHPISAHVIFTDKFGKEYDVICIKDFCKDHNIPYNGMTWRLHKKRFKLPNRDGWKIRYAE